MREGLLATPSFSRQLLEGAKPALFIAVWLGIVYAQVMIVSRPAAVAAHCSPFAFSWDTFGKGNATMAVVVIAAAGVSGYLVCARRKGWGDGALVASIVVCAILTALVALLASAVSSMALSEPVVVEAPLSVPMTIIAYSLTVLPGLAAINTLAVCRVLSRSDVLPWGAAWRAALVPASWFGLGIVVFLAATAVYCG